MRHDPNDLQKLAERKHGIDAQGRSIPKNTPLTIRSHAWHVDFVGADEMAFVREISTKVVMMDAGRVVEVGSPSAIFETPAEARTQSFIKAIIRH